MLHTRRSFREKDYLVTATVHDTSGQELRPGRDWSHSERAGGRFVYLAPPVEGSTTVDLVPVGGSMASLSVTVQRWASGARPPEEVFEAVYLVGVEERLLGPVPERVRVWSLPERSAAGAQP